MPQNRHTPPPPTRAMRAALREVTNEQTLDSEKMQVPKEQLRKLRHAMSQQVLRTRQLTNRPSQIDLLDSKKITSFGEVSLNIVENYFPLSPQALHEPIDHRDPSWMVLLHKKLRWRWRLKGLLPEDD